MSVELRYKFNFKRVAFVTTITVLMYVGLGWGIVVALGSPKPFNIRSLVFFIIGVSGLIYMGVACCVLLKSAFHSVAFKVSKGRLIFLNRIIWSVNLNRVRGISSEISPRGNGFLKFDLVDGTVVSLPTSLLDISSSVLAEDIGRLILEK